MTAVAEAAELWARQLNEASRQHLAVDWSAEASTLVVEAPAFGEALLAGRSVRWSEFGATSSLESIAVRAAEFRKTRGSDCLTLVVGAVRFGPSEDWLPVGLVPLTVRRVARRVDDWTVAPVGPPELCRVTASVLSLDFGVDLQLTPDVTTSFDMLGASLPEDVEFDSRTGLTFHASEWLDILRDIRSFGSLRRSPLVAALAAGTPDESVDLLEVRSPSKVTVLESDTSQAEVVTRALGGQTLVVEGPPGTGKSQTIANIAAELAGHGRRVLIVAQKRAAIDVLVRRLADAGLADLTLDLFDDNSGLTLQRNDSRADTSARVGAEGDAIPDLAASEAHHAVVSTLTRQAAAALRHRSDALPTLSYEEGCQLQTDADRARSAIAAVTRAVATLRQQGFHVPPERLLNLLDAPESSLTEADRNLAFVEDSSRPVGTALDLQRLAASWIAASSELSDSATVGQLRSAHATRLVRGFAAGSLREAVVGRARDLLNALEGALGVTWSDGTQLAKVLARVAPLASRPPLSAEVASLLSDLEVGKRPAIDAAVEEVRPAIRALATATEGLRPHRPALADLDASGVLQTLLRHPDPVAAFDGVLARALLGAPAVLPAATLDVVADRAAAEIDAKRTQRVVELSGRARAGLGARATGNGAATQVESIRRKSAGKRLAARDLGEAIGAVLQSHAVVLASPASVARLFPAITDVFDTVIFEEASQVEVAAAVPALARAHQALVFGDSYQLPPTRFFRTAQADVPHPVLGMDSLLDAFATLLAGTDRRAMLRWHYRSSDDRLVSFVANSPTFYGGQLVLSPSAPGLSAPVELRRVDAATAVDKVVELVCGLEGVGSLAVVTFGVNTSRTIERGLELARYVPAPGFVVRSVEQMQGDERDTIIVVLPLTTDRTSPLQALGPLNQVGGERRLNVAITRARQKMIVVSPYGSWELAGATARGAVTLRQYLEHLERGTNSEFADGPSDNDVLSEIVGILEAGGLEAVTYPRTSVAAVRLSASAEGGAPVAVDIDVVDQYELPVHDREVVRRGELRRRGWKVCRTTLREWIDDGDGQVALIRSTSLGHQ